MSQSLTVKPHQQVSRYNEADINQEMTILRSAFPKLKADDHQLRALVVAAQWSKLSPFRGEIYFVPGIGITVAAKIRANDAVSYQAHMGNTLNISFDRVTAEMCAIPSTDFTQYAGVVEKNDVAFLCRIISSKQRKDYFDMRLQIITELKALGYSGRELENEVNLRSGKTPESRGLGIVKGPEDFGEAGKKFVAFPREDRAMKRALTKALAIGGYAAPDMRSYGGVSLEGEKPASDQTVDGDYSVMPNEPDIPRRPRVTMPADVQMEDGWAIDDAPAQADRNHGALRGHEDLKSPKPFGEDEPVVAAAQKLGGTVRPSAPAPAPTNGGKVDLDTKRVQLVAELKRVNGQLASAGLLDILGENASDGNDSFAALGTKIKRANDALEKATLLPA